VGNLAAMASTNGKSQTGPDLTAQVIAAERLARAIVSAFDACEDSDAELTQRQKIPFVEASLLEFDGFGADLRLVALIRDALGPHERPAA
jgi:hypothetical protein